MQSLYDFCHQNDRMELLEEWDDSANLPLTPKDISKGSSRKVWWRCGEGHTWQGEPWVRSSRKAGCPVCSGKRIVSGINDLCTVNPDLAAQWHPDKNGTLLPSAVSPFSHQKVWWRCGQGHEWSAQIRARHDGSGCPVCRNRQVVSGENDLETLRPDLAAQWHPEKNLPLTPRDVAPGMTQKIWWRCGEGHEWESRISTRAVGNDCPICSGRRVQAGVNDLATLCGDVAAEWHPTRNGALLPSQVTEQSNRLVWWQCREGHSWKTAIATRTVRKSGCPYCANRKVLAGFNDLATLLPSVAAQWHPSLNGELTPSMVTVGSSRKVWWQCEQGHVWKTVISSRTGPEKCGCPVCAGHVRRNRPGMAPDIRSAIL